MPRAPRGEKRPAKRPENASGFPGWLEEIVSHQEPGTILEIVYQVAEDEEDKEADAKGS